jgi:hypothetical protein
MWRLSSAFLRHTPCRVNRGEEITQVSSSNHDGPEVEPPLVTKQGS